MSEVNSTLEPNLQEVAAPNLGLQDIVALLNIVDAASRRGAFRAEEMSAIGAVYDKVSAFLKSTGAVQETDTTEQPTRSE